MTEKNPRLISARFFFTNTFDHFDTRRTQLRDALAVHFRVRIAAGDDHAGNARFDDRIGAGRRFALVGAGFQRDV